MFPVSIRVSGLRLAVLGVRLAWIRVMLAGITFNMMPWLTILKTEVIFEATSILFSRKAWWAVVLAILTVLTILTRALISWALVALAATLVRALWAAALGIPSILRVSSLWVSSLWGLWVVKVSRAVSPIFLYFLAYFL